MPIIRRPPRAEGEAEAEDKPSTEPRRRSGEYLVVFSQDVEGTMPRAAPRATESSEWRRAAAVELDERALIEDVERRSTPPASPLRIALPSLPVPSGLRKHGQEQRYRSVRMEAVRPAAPVSESRLQAVTAHAGPTSSTAHARESAASAMALAQDLPEPPPDEGEPSSGRVLDAFNFYDEDEASVALELRALPVGHVAVETIAGPSPASSPRPGSVSQQAMVAVREPARASGELRAALAAPVPTSRSSREIQAAVAQAAARRGSPHTAQALRASSPEHRAAPRPGIVAFGGFGLRPENLFDTPAYALRVLSRRRVLQAGLATARAQRAQDVELYESALMTADATAVTHGLSLIAAVLAVGILGVLTAISFL